VKLKAKFLFQVKNGRFVSEVRKFLDLSPLERKKVFLSFKPCFPGLLKVDMRLFMPTRSRQESYSFRIIPLPELHDKKSRLVKVKKRYYSLRYHGDGKTYYSKLSAAGSSFQPGEDLLVHLQITSREGLSHLKIVDYLPSGFEFVENYQDYHLYRINPNLNYGVIRQDEKLIFPIPELSKGVYNIYYILKARISGKYYQPGFYLLKSEKILFSKEEDRYFTIKTTD
jgi:hypothetical protein